MVHKYWWVHWYRSIQTIIIRGISTAKESIKPTRTELKSPSFSTSPLSTSSAPSSTAGSSCTYPSTTCTPRTKSPPESCSTSFTRASVMILEAVLWACCLRLELYWTACLCCTFGLSVCLFTRVVTAPFRFCFFIVIIWSFSAMIIAPFSGSFACGGPVDWRCWSKVDRCDWTSALSTSGDIIFRFWTFLLFFKVFLVLVCWVWALLINFCASHASRDQKHSVFYTIFTAIKVSSLFSSIFVLIVRTVPSAWLCPGSNSSPASNLILS